MPQDKRTFFITSVCHDRVAVFRKQEAADLLIETLMHYRAANKYLLHAFVAMPDHIHLLLTPAQGITVERAVQFIKGGFSHRLGGTRELWQRGFTQHRIEDSNDFHSHHVYIHENPVRARIVMIARDYRYSSANPAHFSDLAPEHLRG
jgi:putative transposase